MGCIWVSIGFSPNGWVTNKTWSDRNGDFKIEDMTNFQAFEIYWTSIYFISATITTVGYGDISAYMNVNGGENNSVQIIFVMLLEFFGILTLTYISNAILEIESKINVDEMV